MKERECFCVGERERVRVNAYLCGRMNVSGCVCACVRVSERERARARARVWKKEQERETGGEGKWGRWGGERD